MRDAREKEGRRTFRYSMNRFKKATKCSAFRMFPGIASWIRSSDNTVMREGRRSQSRFNTREANEAHQDSQADRPPQHPLRHPEDPPPVSHTHLEASERPFPSSCLSPVGNKSQPRSRRVKKGEGTHSSIFSPNLVTLFPAASSIGLVRSTDNDSMQTLSESTKEGKHRLREEGEEERTNRCCEPHRTRRYSPH